MSLLPAWIRSTSSLCNPFIVLLKKTLTSNCLVAPRFISRKRCPLLPPPFPVCLLQSISAIDLEQPSTSPFFQPVGDVLLFVPFYTLSPIYLIKTERNTCLSDLQISSVTHIDQGTVRPCFDSTNAPQTTLGLQTLT